MAENMPPNALGAAVKTGSEAGPTRMKGETIGAGSAAGAGIQSGT